MAPGRTQRLTGFITRWAKDPARRQVVRDANLARLEQALAVRDTHVVATRANGYGTWLCGEGQARVLAGDLEGWQEVRLGCAVLRYGRLVAHRSFARSRGARTEPCEPIGCANVVALSLALDDPQSDELQRWHLEGWVRSEDLPPYAIYTQALLELCAGRQPTRAAACGPFEPILREWERDGFGPALDGALEWHTGPGVSDSDAATGEFVDIVAHAFPVEVLAALAVRRRLGLSVPKLTHPLGLTPLCTTSAVGPWPDDPLLEPLRAFVEAI